ncbi:hypothetical protein RMATCC62417_10199 [Rhizopus microsporus]|nr:hypothetical protein RMATCC62417_10199 [Rhizopus microsporus]
MESDEPSDTTSDKITFTPAVGYAKSIAASQYTNVFAWDILFNAFIDRPYTGTAFNGLPDGYWIRVRRHCHLITGQFFTYDVPLECLHPLLSIDGPPYPRLSNRMLHDLHRRHIQFTPTFWDHIVHRRQPTGSIDFNSLFQSFQIIILEQL